ncbi:MAG: hypothetical protein KatS3mg099_210 [Candidatus Parcubacteria bacterium]|nr:MAG: hypothetical protein KatS3mg099_210 [Candidatus Parcubacteria bacterium]
MQAKPTLRLPAGEAAYQQERAARQAAGDSSCPLCRAPDIRAYRFWRLIPNHFPYDKIARTHHMLVPKRCVPEEEIAAQEWEELTHIKRELAPAYHFYMETTIRQRSVRQHYHLHCVELGGPCSLPTHDPFVCDSNEEG